MTQILLECGADIHEINTLRKHLDRVKGGHLVKRLAPARILSLILSDVIGDSLDMIASGPTVPDPTTFQDAMKVIEKYDLSQQMPISIIETIEDGMGSRIEETLKPQSSELDSVSNFLIGSNIKAAEAAAYKAKELGYNTQIISSHLTGDTESTANFLGGIIKSVISHCVPLKRPACLLFGGETTVKISGKGKGGRNQDLVLRMVKELADKPGILFTSLATDGEDGPTDAAGASADNLVIKDSKEKLNQSIQEFIDNNDSYHFFSKIGGLIKTGATGTNVNDLMIILIK
jgi:glycerate-2-kinase